MAIFNISFVNVINLNNRARLKIKSQVLDDPRMPVWSCKDLTHMAIALSQPHVGSQVFQNPFSDEHVEERILHAFSVGISLSVIILWEPDQH